ncbi:AAA family ATPase [Myroides odoratimimus]|uniref:AAA family ATPase n=1 Tax=Myroides odoratimimus TaxID=76832 RepID=UPI002576B780|nr:AAA family ATPase [Myroides odoratimimus]MDM1465148.1 AAA family ATPase [Myroides odoratimimus]MDM1475135.1 AAA family ATPase [Myroides odoratimimus]
MITKINLNNIASYKSLTTLATDKKVNLIYGLNGTGKSTLSNYLNQQTDEKYNSCSVEGIDHNHEILVYNQTFIHETFFEAENLKGIFTLSKENKEAETKISNAQKEITKLESEKDVKLQELNTEKISINQKKETAKNAVWKIKTDYSGGDRVLEFCLDGYKGSKDNLFNHIVALVKPTVKPTKTIDDLKIDLQSISGDNAQKYSALSEITFASQSIETEILFNKQIVGNKNSTVSQLIKELGNSDWVKEGLQYLPEEEAPENTTCPFCQEKTISNYLVDSIKNYFDASYEADINSLKSFLEEYIQAFQAIPSKTIFEANPKFETHKKDFEIKYNALIKVIEDNKKLIEDKIKMPSVSVTLKSSTRALEEINDVIQKINGLVTEHNKNFEQKETVKTNIKKSFWEIMRWDYDQTISSFNGDKTISKSKTDALEVIIKDNTTKITAQNAIIAEQQKQTVNIEEAITNINSGLIDLGITDFKIQKYSENLYKIIRGENQEKVFRSLSEGEKMIISFLYFTELCRGKKEAIESGKKKIIVIDDPISSLSHVYIFNIGRLIKNEFFGKKENKKDTVTGEKFVEWNYKYEQVFILTHSLYFFYEITETKHDERKETQKLFRLSKNEKGSYFSSMNYEEIQNDYQAYWFIIKDESQHPALIANSMRNIIEYFFNFVEKKDLNNFFLQEPLKGTRFQAFYRYINRESHSLGQNIFDFKEFNYQDFKDAFSELFKVAGYEAHYKKMIKR